MMIVLPRRYPTGALPFQGRIMQSGRIGRRSYPIIFNDQSTLLATSLSIACPAGAGNAVTILWGDGSSSPLTCDGTVRTYTKNYAATGTYQISVVGDVARITTFICWYQSWLSGAYSNVIAGLVDVEKLHIWGCSFTGSAGDFGHLLLVTDLLYTRGANLLVDGDAEAVGVAAWSAYNSTLTKQSNPYQGNRCLRVVMTGTSAITYQTILTVGKTYRITGAARSNATGFCSVYCSGSTPSAYQLPVAQTTEFVVYDETFVCGNPQIRFATFGVVSDYSEHDAPYITEVV